MKNILLFFSVASASRNGKKRDNSTEAFKVPVVSTSPRLVEQPTDKGPQY